MYDQFDITVIIPAYNADLYIASAISSALSQSYGRSQVIVVDDGSTDGTWSEIQAYGDRIISLRQSNRGVSSARNLGLRRADGDFVAFLDADDVWQTSFLERIICAFDQSPETSCMYAWWDYIDDSGDILPEKGTASFAGDCLAVLAKHNFVPPSAIVFRRSVIESVDGFDEQLRSREDWDLLLRIAQSGRRFGYVPETLIGYRIHKFNKSSRFDLSEGSQLAVLDKFYGKPDVPPNLAALEPVARATVYLNSYIGWHQAGDEAMAYQKYRQAVITWPDILVQRETYYRLICADQPPGYRDTEFFKDLAAARHRIESLLTCLEADESIGPLLAERQNAAQACASLALAEHHYRAGHRAAALSAIGRAARFEPIHLLSPHFHRSWVRALLGHSLIQRTRTALTKR